MTHSDAQGNCVLYLSDVHGEFDTFAYLIDGWRDDLRWAHLVGDVYDRGPAPDKIIDLLMAYPDADIQWGNHDVVWMGAALGQPGCIAHVVRNCARYGNLDILTSSYGIDLAPLARFALSAYADDPCDAFALKSNPGLTDAELKMNVKIQKAMAVLQFKIEAALIDKYPSFGLKDRKLLHLIDYDTKTVTVDGVIYELTDIYFPTVDRDDPYRLTDEEQAVMDYLVDAFTGCEKLARHIRFLFERGSLYKICDGDLLAHACVPLNGDGTLKEVDIFGVTCKGKGLYDEAQKWVRTAFESDDEAMREKGRDLIWYLWLGPGSPLFAKSKMATFEIYLCKDKAARKEEKNAFYLLLDEKEPYERIFEDFGLDPARARIICGHVPVKAKDGEDPVKAGGRVICIDGGMSAAYSKTTGLQGYALTRKDERFTLFAIRSFDKDTKTIVTETREIPPR